MVTVVKELALRFGPLELSELIIDEKLVHKRERLNYDSKGDFYGRRHAVHKIGRKHDGKDENVVVPDTDKENCEDRKRIAVTKLPVPKERLKRAKKGG